MLRELGYLKGSMVEPHKVSWCSFVEWCYSSLVEYGHVVSIITACSPNHMAWYA